MEMTVNAISEALRRDRRTVSKAINAGELKPIRSKGRAKYYYLADVVNALSNTGDLDFNQERAKLAIEQQRKLKRENDLAERKVILLDEMVDILQQVSKQAVSILDALPLNIKRRVPMLKARDIEYIKLEIAKSRNAIAGIQVRK